MRPLTAATALALGLLLLTGLPAPATAGHLGVSTAVCTYEVGQIDSLQLSAEDPTGLTTDGGINLGGCNWRLEPRHADVPSASVPLEADPDVAQVSIVDDFFGNEVGAFFCNDANDDHTCADENPDEILQFFCGTSPPFQAEADTDGDGRKDFGHHIFVALNGPVWQALECDATTNPVGAVSGGVLDPAGGVFMQYS